MNKFAAWKRPFYSGEAGPIAIAHRGGDAAGAEKENTFAAFQSASSLGFTYMETDAIVTSDGKVLAFHGSDYELKSRIAHIPTRKSLQKMTYEQISRQIRVGGEKLVLMEEVLTAFPKAKLFIDPKTYEVVEPLARLIDKLDARDRVCIGAYRHRRARMVADILGGPEAVATSLIRKDPFSVIQLILFPSLAAQRGVVSVHPAYNKFTRYLITKRVIDKFKKRGIYLVVWTVNKPALINEALKKGIHGVMSDKAQLVKELVERHG